LGTRKIQVRCTGGTLLFELGNKAAVPYKIQGIRWVSVSNGRLSRLRTISHRLGKTSHLLVTELRGIVSSVREWEPLKDYYLSKIHLQNEVVRFLPLLYRGRKGTHDWGACALVLHKGFVKVGEHPVAELDAFTNAGECFFAELPRFLLLRFSPVDSEKGEKTRRFCPAHQEFFGHIVTESSHIRSYERNSAYGKSESHGNACLEVTQWLKLSPSQRAAYWPIPVLPLLESRNGRFSGRLSRSPFRVAFAIPVA
jgi:hypothetical protein